MESWLSQGIAKVRIANATALVNASLDSYFVTRSGLCLVHPDQLLYPAPMREAEPRREFRYKADEQGTVSSVR